jgi:hypothetical protein
MPEAMGGPDSDLTHDLFLAWEDQNRPLICPLNRSILEYDFDGGKGKEDEPEPSRVGADHRRAEAG